MVKALDYRPTGPRFQPWPTIATGIFSPRSLLSSAKTKVSRSMKVFLPAWSLHHVLGRGCKAVGPGVLVSISIQLLAISSYLVSHPTGGFYHREEIRMYTSLLTWKKTLDPKQADLLSTCTYLPNQVVTITFIQLACTIFTQQTLFQYQPLNIKSSFTSASSRSTVHLLPHPQIFARMYGWQ